jgi:hypothetical protein
MGRFEHKEVHFGRFIVSNRYYYNIPWLFEEANMKRGCGGCANALFFFLIFFGVGAGLSYWGWTILQNAQASANWPSVQGQVTSSDVERSTDGEGGTSYQPQIDYSYTVNDQRYSGDRVNFGQNSYSSRRGAEEVAARYPVGQSVAVYYDPVEPDSAVLEPGVSSGSYIVISIGACFVLISLILAPILVIAGRRGSN